MTWHLCLTAENFIVSAQRVRMWRVRSQQTYGIVLRMRVRGKEREDDELIADLA
jgi:hypothetical protein